MSESPVLTITLLPKTPTQKDGYASKKVDLRNADISVIPKHLFTTFRDITVLNLAQNELEVLPDQIGILIFLRKLFLDRNKLQQLPNSLGKLQELTTLDISDNLLTSLPDTLAYCTSLRCLEMPNNKFTVLPPVIHRMNITSGMFF